MTTRLAVGFIPLVDAAPLIVAEELGFAAEEGLAFDLIRAPSWSILRDMLALGTIEAAHMLAPVPVAIALGLGGVATRLDALSVLSVNGNVLGVSADLADRMRLLGYRFDFKDPVAAGRALIAAAPDQLRIGVPFPFSMHAELLYYWLAALGVRAPQGIDIHTVPPPLMAKAMAAGDIDAFWVGEPWGSVAVETGVGELLLPGTAIWAFAPDKVLAVRHDWTAAEPDLTGRLIRTLWRAGRWLDDKANHITAAEVLSRPAYLDLSSELIERSLSGRLVISGRGVERQATPFIAFHKGAAGFPWRSQAAWIGTQLAARNGLDPDAAAQAARRVFRSDLYRQALRGTGAALPGASEKVEGGISAVLAVASESGKLFLQPDQFFDGRVFDPLGPNR